MPTTSFDMKISVDGLFFIGSQLVALSYNYCQVAWDGKAERVMLIASGELQVPIS